MDATQIALPTFEFDEWMSNPYTKALHKSIAEDYVPRHDNELRRAVRAMVSMLNDREWGEHVSRDADASDLEAAITTLIGEVSEKQARINELEQALAAK